MLLSNLLRRENNSIDLLRLIAALTVIYGHAYAIHPQPPSVDLINKLIDGEYSGSIAVKFFFFLSGIVVSNSLLNNPSLRTFAISRLLRLVPALFFCLLLTSFAIGPIFSSLPTGEYFSDATVYRHFWSGLKFTPEWILPGVFSNHPNTAVNGSLWTLPIELACYITLFFIAALDLFKTRWLSFIVTSFLLATFTLMYLGVLPLDGKIHSEATLLKFYFFAGVWLCIIKDSFEINFYKILILITLVWITRNTTMWSTALVFTTFIAALWICSLPRIRAIKLPGDYSYGVYLYGFIIQQAMHNLFPNMDIHMHQVASMIIALAFGIFSWHVIENPVMTWWKKSAFNQRLDVLHDKPAATLSRQGA